MTDNTLRALLLAIDDSDCRAILGAIDGESKAVKKLSEECDVPLSTTYRKLDLLSEASLLEEQVEIRADGQHTTRYVVAFDEVRIALDEDRAIEVAIKRRSGTPEERLSSLWSEVRKET